MDDVVIVGGGIIGAATAYFLSKEGRKAVSYTHLTLPTKREV